MYRTHYTKEAKENVGQKVKIAGWVHDFRNLGKLKFVLLRDRTGIIQVTMKKGLVPDEIVDIDVNREDVVQFEGEVKENKVAPDGVELIPSSFEMLNKVEKKLPVDPADHVKAELDTRLDYRYIDLRRKPISAIFTIKSVVVNAFRKIVLEKDFVEINPTTITGAATEGGADVFPIQYFENQAYLVQSPQLYKQLSVIGGFDKVFMTVPVFRAEKHNTSTHLNEITQMDIEMGFADHEDVMDILSDVTVKILDEVKKQCPDQLAELGVELEVPKVGKYTYTDLVDKLVSNGFEMKWGEDFSKEAEKKLQGILGEDLYLIDDWPTPIRAFYSMPKGDGKTCNAFDLVYKGLEIASGAQRIHKVDILKDQLEKRGLDPYKFEFYTNAFKVGAPPHAGWSLGLERLTMKMCGLENIREAMLFPRDRTRVHP